MDRPELLAHDLADEGWTDSGIKAIYYQFAADEDSLEADWLTYDELDKPAMREEYFGNIYAKAEDNAGNVSDAIFAGFMFEQTEPVAEKTLTPNFWTNGTVEIDLSVGDNLSGVRDITLPCLLYTSCGNEFTKAGIQRDEKAAGGDPRAPPCGSSRE